MTDPAPPIDLDHLAQYTAGDAALEAEILGMFLPSAAGYIEQMQSAGVGAGWADAAHGLKGVARGVGALEIAALAETAETVDAGDRKERERQVEQLNVALDRARAFIEARREAANDG